MFARVVNGRTSEEKRQKGKRQEHKKLMFSTYSSFFSAFFHFRLMHESKCITQKARFTYCNCVCRNTTFDDKNTEWKWKKWTKHEKRWKSDKKCSGKEIHLSNKRIALVAIPNRCCSVRSRTFVKWQPKKSEKKNNGIEVKKRWRTRAQRTIQETF